MDVDELLHLVSIGGGEPRTGEYTGTKALLLAVLENGMASYLGPAGRAYDEAEAWMSATSGRFPFSFIVICETLGLEPDAVRVALAQQRSQRHSRRAMRRLRGNVRHARLQSAA